MREIKSKLEAILFCSQDGRDVKSLAKLCSIGSVGHVKSVLKSLQEDYVKRGSGLKIYTKEGLWFLGICDEHLGIVREAAQPEMDKAVLSTLAYIAHKKDIRQSDVIRIRSNKAYEHIKNLVSAGLIEARREGSTKRLSPSKKFYDYFNLKEGEVLQVDE